MAKDVERLVLELSADVSRLERGLKAGGASTSRYARQTEKRFDEMNRRTSRSVADMTSSITRMVGLLGAAFSVQAVVRYADAYTNLQNRLKAVGLEGERLANIENELFAAANRNGVAVDAVTQLFQRASLSREQLGATDEQLIALTNGVSAALRVQGVSATDAKGPLLQLGQALGAGTVRAEELNSLLEGTPIILQAAAKGSARFAGDMQAMAKAVRDGKVSSQELFQALLVGLPALEEQAASLPKTVGQAMQVLDNELGRFIGKTDESFSASQRLAQGIEALAQNLDTVALVVGAVATIIGTKYVLALTASTTAMLLNAVATGRLALFQAAMTASMTGTTVATNIATGAMARFNAMLLANPIGAALVAVAALAAGLAFLHSKFDPATLAARELNTAVGAADTVLGEYEEALRKAAGASGEAAVKAREEAAAIRETTLARIQDLRVLAQQRAADAAAARAAEGNAARAVPAPGIGQGPTGAAIRSNRELNASNAARARVAAETSANAAFDALKKALDAFATAPARAAAVLGGNGAGASAAAGAGRAASGPAPAELAAMREQLSLQGLLDLAEARGDEAEAKRVKRLIDIAALTAQFTRAQIEGAEALATAQIDAVIAAEDVGKEIDQMVEASERRAEERLAANEALTAEMDRQLRVQIDLARIEGNEVVVRMLERELALRQQIASLGPNASPELVARVRGDEAMLNRAEDQAIFRERGADMARTFVDIIKADDIGAEIGNRFRAAAFDGLEAILGNLFGQIFAGQGGGGGNVLANVASAIFGGNRALGGPVKAGKAYRVNENTPNSEIFVPNRDGWVGNMKQPRGGARAVQNITVRNELYLAGANGDSVIYGNVRAMLAASQRQTVAAIKAGAPSAQLEQTLLRE
jgi:tape measure domain-containing protein